MAVACGAEPTAKGSALKLDSSGGGLPPFDEGMYCGDEPDADDVSGY